MVAEAGIKQKTVYCNSKELEEWWGGWNTTECQYAWEKMGSNIYNICCGVARHFHPKDEDEFCDHVHDAYMQTMEKIQKKKLKFTPGRAPVFNLITTTAFRILYSKMNRQKKVRINLKKYTYRFVQAHIPDMLNKVEYPFPEKHAAVAQAH
jgi:hypothetical protein